MVGKKYRSTIKIEISFTETQPKNVNFFKCILLSLTKVLSAVILKI